MTQEQQSPINLTNPLFSDFGKNGLKIHWKKSILGKLSSDHRGVVDFGSDDRQFVSLDRKKFHMVQFHFHHPSEHWVDGIQLTFELHVVHQNIDDGSRVVVGIFLEGTDKPAKRPLGIEWLSNSVADASNTNAKYLNPTEWLPDKTDQYFRYEGSLTTEPFTENVSWVILKHFKFIPMDCLNELIREFKHPARFCQPLNRRYLLANWK